MRDEHYIEMRGKRYVLYEGLLAMAHERGLQGVDEEIIQLPTSENGDRAIVKATAETEDGRSFSGIGDASPENVGRNIVPHVLRMASTRAKARCFRDMCNIGTTALEELSDGEESGTRTSSQSQSQGQEGASPTPISRGREKRSRDDELTPGGVPVGRANELIALLIKAGNKREEVGPYVWNAKPEAVEKKMNELKEKG